MLGARKEKKSAPSVQDTSDRINKKGATLDDKIKRLDADLSSYREQIKRTRPGPAHDAVKARATRLLNQKRMYEAQKETLYNQTFNLDQAAFAAEGLKDAKKTRRGKKQDSKQLKGSSTCTIL